MIATLNGQILALQPDSLILDIQGIGFEVFVPKHTLVEQQAGHSIFLYTHLVVREDLLALYGFVSPEEKQFFLHFLAVDGIGPKLALAILSNLSLDMLRTAIVSEQADIFSRVPGIGKKTAQKILIHMQGKITKALELEGVQRLSSADDQILEALTGLGYSVIEAQTAIQALPKDTPDTVEDKLRIALQYFDH